MKVFISHSTLDRELLDEHIIYIFLEYFTKEDQIQLDGNRTIGQHYVQIVNGIEACDTFIVIITIKSIGSDSVLNKISLAFIQSKMIIPIKVKDAVSKQYSVLIGNITPAKYSTTINDATQVEKYLINSIQRFKENSDRKKEEIKTKSDAYIANNNEISSSMRPVNQL